MARFALALLLLAPLAGACTATGAHSAADTSDSGLAGGIRSPRSAAQVALEIARADRTGDSSEATATQRKAMAAYLAGK